MGQPIEVWTLGQPQEGPGALPVQIRRFGGRPSLRIQDLARLLWGVKTEAPRKPAETLWILASYGAQLVWLWSLRLGWVPRNSLWIPIFHGSELLRYRRKPRWHALWQQIPRPVSVGVVSRFVKNLFEATFPKLSTPNQVLWVPGAPRHEMRKLAESSALFEIPDENPYVVLTVGRLHPRKGHLEVAQALGRLPPVLKEKTTYLVAGPAQQDSLRSLQALCQKTCVNFHYLGKVSPEDLATIYRRCQVFAMASRQLGMSVEGLGLVYLEAGLWGKPSVGYRTGGVEDAILHEQTGLLVPEGNVEKLANALERLLSSPSLRQKLGAQARKHALQFSWEKTGEALLCALQPKPSRF